jgi:2-dehydropantoate 2-reductase
MQPSSAQERVGRMQPIWIVGAGAVGGYIAVHLARAGYRVHLFDGWEAHVAVVQASGLIVEEPSGDIASRLHISITGAPPPDNAPCAVILACKMAETARVLDWLEDGVAYGGLYIATLNGLADADVARRVGAQRVLGCIVSGLHGELVKPGVLARRASRGGRHAVFRVGEVEVPASQRSREWADVLSAVDTAVAIDDLQSERWTKLQYNAMTSALSAVVERPVRDLCLDPGLRKRMIDIGLEVVATSTAKGIRLGAVCGIDAQIWRAAGKGDTGVRRRIEAGVIAYGKTMDQAARSGSAQDRARGRASEVDMINGAVVREAQALGLDAPANQTLWDELVAMERAEGSR